MGKLMKIFKILENIFLSEHTKKRIEKVILYVALISFFIHLIIIGLSKFDIISLFPNSELLLNPISDIYTPFSFILIY